MERLTMTTTAAGPVGQFVAGRTYVVEDRKGCIPPGMAEAFLAGGFAKRASDRPEKKPAAEGGNDGAPASGPLKKVGERARGKFTGKHSLVDPDGNVVASGLTNDEAKARVAASREG